jgi:ABC-type branched-subunit amino acid transport system substrate-binding protein
MTAPLALVLGLSAAVALAACGSSSSSSSASSSTAASSAAASATNTTSSSGAAGATGTPIKIGLIASATGVTAEPWVIQGAEIGVKAANAAGGINGHPIVLDSCDDGGSSQADAVCAQKLLVQDKVPLLVGNDGTYDTAVPGVLKAAHTIVWSGEMANVGEWESTNVFTPQVEVANYNLIPQLLPPGKHRVVLFTADIAAGIAGSQAAEPLYKARGDAVTIVTVPLTATDFSTPCLQAKKFNADTGIVVFDGLTQFAPMAQACNLLGEKLTWAMEGSVISNSELQALQTLGLKSVITVPFSSKAFTDLKADSAKYGIQDTNIYNDAGMDSYIGFKLLPTLIKDVGSTNGAAIQSYLSKQTAFSTNGYTPPINFTPAHHFLTFVGLHNTCMYKDTLQNGSLVQTDPNAICL